MLNKIKDMLMWIGYEFVEQDNDLLVFLLDKNIQYALNACNVTEIPEGLEYKIVERVVGEFLQVKKANGQLGSNFNFDAVPKSIKEGDTAVTYAYGEGSLTPEQNFNKLVDFLLNNFERHIKFYRRIRW